MIGSLESKPVHDYTESYSIESTIYARLGNDFGEGLCQQSSKAMIQNIPRRFSVSRAQTQQELKFSLF